MAVAWHSFDLVSGRRGPKVEVKKLGAPERILCESTNTVLDLVVWNDNGPVAGWRENTQPGLTMLVAIDDTGDDEVILWGGEVLLRPKTATTAQVSVVTLEHYFERRYTGDFERLNVDAAEIAADVAALANVDGINLAISWTPCGVPLSVRHFDYEDLKISDVLNALSDLDGGPEFTVELAWTDADHTAITKTLVIGPRLGVAPTIPTQWDMPGCLVDIKHVEDYTTDKGANSVLATSSGEGEERPSARATDSALVTSAGWPLYERRFQPSTSITDTDTLDSHAAADLQRTRLGLTEMSVVANLAEAPRLGKDWSLGDDITTTVTCPTFPESRTANGDFLPGFTGRLRVVGYTVDLDARRLTPKTREVD